MEVTVAATQMACSWDIDANVKRAEQLVHEAADSGAQIVLIQELFEAPYFCIDAQARHFDLAKPLSEQPTVRRMQTIAKERGVVIPVSYFEKSGLAYYNSVAMVDADGSILGIYHKEPVATRAPGRKRRKALLDSAYDLLYENDIEDVSFRDIARRGVP
jgi:N-carbamoylputrescine amidase